MLPQQKMMIRIKPKADKAQMEGRERENTRSSDICQSKGERA